MKHKYSYAEDIANYKSDRKNLEYYRAKTEENLASLAELKAEGRGDKDEDVARLIRLISMGRRLIAIYEEMTQLGREIIELDAERVGLYRKLEELPD